jgi:hypothetical protein
MDLTQNSRYWVKNDQITLPSKYFARLVNKPKPAEPLRVTYEKAAALFKKGSGLNLSLSADLCAI